MWDDHFVLVSSLSVMIEDHVILVELILTTKFRVLRHP